MKVALLVAALIAMAGPSEAGQRAASPADATVLVRLVGSVHAEIEEPGQTQTVDRDRVELGSGSGFVISPLGYVLTNEHVVGGNQIVRDDGVRKTTITMKISRIEVCFSPDVVRSGAVAASCSDASVYASDPALDLAVLFVNASNLPYLALGDSDVVTSGQPVQALGFPFGRALGLEQGAASDSIPEISTTAGSISAIRADELGEQRRMQISANVNPGNSGGPVVDRDGFAVGVVFARVTEAVGIGLAIPINQAKDFLESRGLGNLMPVRRLRLGPVHRLEGKGMALRLPDGAADVSPRRVRVETDPGQMDVALRIDRVLSPWTLKQIEEAMVGTQAFEPFARTSNESRVLPAGAGAQFLLGRATGTASTGSTALATSAATASVEVGMAYAALDLGREKLVARFLGPIEQVAFNAGVLRDALASLEGQPILATALEPVASLEWARAPATAGQRAGLPVPEGWLVEPGAPSICRGVPAASASGTVTPVRDFTVALRVAVWPVGAFTQEDAASACSPRRGGLGRASYVSREDTLGVTYAVEGVFVRVGEEVVQAEVRAPAAQAAYARNLLAVWVKQTAE